VAAGALSNPNSSRGNGRKANNWVGYAGLGKLPANSMQRIRKFLSELLRRKVVRLIGAYIVALWLLVQGMSDVFPIFGAPDWALRAFTIAGIVLILPLAWLSWKFNLAPPRLVPDTGDRETVSPHLAWAQLRHENSEAGFILLRWEGKDKTAHERRFFKPLSIGRLPGNEVQLPDERVSRHHAVLWAENEAWYVRDNSTNGTFLDHVRITNQVRLPHEGELKFHVNGPVVHFIIDKPTKTIMS
jgi:hypothetical protein